MTLTSEYFLLVFCSAMGFIQVAAGQSRLKGLLLTQKPLLNRVLGGLLIAPGAVIFFTWNYRNPVGIIEGSQQAGLFTLAALAALGVTLVLGSVTNHFRLKTTRPVTRSIEALKRQDIFSGGSREVNLETLINIDKVLSLFINNLAGRWWVLDELVKGLANDYFLMIGASLGLLFLWFGTAEIRQREINQKLALQAMASLGIATGLVSILNNYIFRVRPFNEIAVTPLLYQPTDSSFPSNSAAILFAIAFAVWFGNRKAGQVFFTIAIVHSFCRVVAGMYYPLDIVGGAAIGGTTALAVRWLFAKLDFLINLLLRMARALFLA